MDDESLSTGASAKDMQINNPFKKTEANSEENSKLIRMVGDPGFPDRRSYDWYKNGPRNLEFQGKDGQNVSALGIAHSRNPDDAINKGIKLSIEGYGQRTADKTVQTLLVEGFHGGIPDALKKEWLASQDPEADYRRLVEESGEMRGAAFLATRAGIEVISPEKPQGEIFDKLRQDGLEGDQIALYYFLRSMPNLPSQDQQYLKLEIVKRAYDLSNAAKAGWLDRELTEQEKIKVVQNPDALLGTLLPKLNEVAVKEIGRPVFIADEQGNLTLAVTPNRTNQLTSPYYNQDYEALNRIAKIDHNERDKYLLGQIEASVNNGKSPLVIFGDSHITAIEPFLNSRSIKSETKPTLIELGGEIEDISHKSTENVERVEDLPVETSNLLDFFTTRSGLSRDEVVKRLGPDLISQFNLPYEEILNRFLPGGMDNRDFRRLHFGIQRYQKNLPDERVREFVWRDVIAYKLTKDEAYRAEHEDLYDVVAENALTNLSSQLANYENSEWNFQEYVDSQQMEQIEKSLLPGEKAEDILIKIQEGLEQARIIGLETIKQGKIPVLRTIFFGSEQQKQEFIDNYRGAENLKPKHPEATLDDLSLKDIEDHSQQRALGSPLDSWTYGAPNSPWIYGRNRLGMGSRQAVILVSEVLPSDLVWTRILASGSSLFGEEYKFYKEPRLESPALEESNEIKLEQLASEGFGGVLLPNEYEITMWGDHPNKGVIDLSV